MYVFCTVGMCETHSVVLASFLANIMIIAQHLLACS